MARWKLDLGATPEADGVAFRVWAPTSEAVEVVIYGPGAERIHPLERGADGYHTGRIKGIGAGARYRYRLDGGESYPDPASRSQPDGVHGPSEVVDPAEHAWQDDDWTGAELEGLVIYELHIGTFTPEGSFDAAAARMPDLADLGVTAVEVMPVADFPGERNWGYDGVNLYAPANAYGGPAGFKRLVDAAHASGLAVILDVVYNHLGPEGNYLPAVTGGRIFTDRHKTPWGDAINFDGDGREGVRHFFIQNALYWANENHVDGLRLDATHAIIDDSPVHILQEIGERMHALPRPRFLIAEDERNERRVVTPVEAGGLGLDGVWADDLHHQLRRLAAGDREGYFAAYSGSVADIAATLRKGWYFDGELPPHEPAEGGDDADAAVGYRGTPSDGIPPHRFVHCIQNHDQVGNRAFGERLNHQIELGSYRALSALLLTSPYTPMLWMGQEWAASSPFLYFTDHPAELGRLVTDGRREEFKHFSAFQDPERRKQIPDPQAAETFETSKLRWEEREQETHTGVRGLYRDLLELRRTEPALRAGDRASFEAIELSEGALALRRDSDGGEAILLVVNFRGESRVELMSRPELRAADERLWVHVLSTEEARYGGTGGWGRLEPDGTLHVTGPGAVMLRAELRS